MPDSKPKIHIAEDDPNLGLLLTDYLEREGFEVHLSVNGNQAIRALQKLNYDVCLLDVMMPLMDGFAVATELRKTNKEIPILFITAKSMKEDKWKGYRVGADDYITKPFDEEELVWKIKALLRRKKAREVEEEIGVVKLGLYSFDSTNQLLVFENVRKRITGKETEILRYLYANRNKVIKREAMLLELWGENDYFLGRSLDVFFTKLRKYLKDDSRISIENVFGVGFIFNVPD